VYVVCVYKVMTLQRVHSVITIIGKQVALIKILIISYSHNIMKWRLIYCELFSNVFYSKCNYIQLHAYKSYEMFRKKILT